MRVFTYTFGVTEAAALMRAMAGERRTGDDVKLANFRMQLRGFASSTRVSVSALYKLEFEPGKEYWVGDKQLALLREAGVIASEHRE